ncbi:MAG: serine hydrolase domain-containing protein [Bacteroidota bacterium]
MKKGILLCTALLLISIIGYGQEGVFIDQNIEQFINDFQATNNGSGIIVGVVDNGKTTYYKLGTTSKKSNNVLSESSIFELGSVSKVFTTAALVNMSDNQELFLNNKIDGYLPKYIIAPRYKNIICTTIEVQLPQGEKWLPAVTSCRPDPFTPEKFVAICDLASHSSGLHNPTVSNKSFHPFHSSDFIKNPKLSFTKDDILSTIDNYLLDCPPGIEFNFSDLGYGVLGIIMSDIAGMEYDHLIAHKLSEKLGLKNTAVWLSTAQRDQVAAGYNHKGKEVKPMLQDAMAPAYGLRSSAEDLVTMLKANLGPAETPLEVGLVEAHHPRIFFETSEKVYGIGLGWFISAAEGNEETKLIWQNGQTAGYASFIGFSKDLQKGIVVLSNSSKDVTPLGMKILEYLASKKMTIRP